MLLVGVRVGGVPSFHDMITSDHLQNQLHSTSIPLNSNAACDASED